MNRRIIITAGLSMALLLCLSGMYTGATAQLPSPGQKLVGTWDVTLRFPVCSTACQCPGGVPNIPIPAMHTYSDDGTMEEMSGGTLFRSDATSQRRHKEEPFNSPTSGVLVLLTATCSEVYKLALFQVLTW
jgi:hypothetical protein